jgi:hypothetical protein
MLNRFIVGLISLGDIAYGFLHPRPLVLVPTALTHHPCLLLHILSIENEKFHLSILAFAQQTFCIHLSIAIYVLA